jgi:hypothetical protein
VVHKGLIPNNHHCKMDHQTAGDDLNARRQDHPEDRAGLMAQQIYHPIASNIKDCRASLKAKGRRALSQTIVTGPDVAAIAHVKMRRSKAN